MLRRPRLLVLGPLLAICVGSSTASAEVKLAALIGSNMVLQQGASLPIWGWAEEGETVTVAIAGQAVSGKAGDDGRWQVTLGKLDVTPNDKPLEISTVRLKFFDLVGSDC